MKGSVKQEVRFCVGVFVSGSLDHPSISSLSSGICPGLFVGPGSDTWLDLGITRLLIGKWG